MSSHRFDFIIYCYFYFMQNEQLAEQIQKAQLQRDDLADQAPPAERRRVTPETVIKRKRLKRQREPTAITATSSEKAILGEKNHN